MSSETPFSRAAAEDAAAAPASNTVKRRRRRSSSDDDSGTWLDVIQKVYDLIQEIIPLIRNCLGMSSVRRFGGSGASSDRTAKDFLTQLANLLPTSTFMTFQVIAPLATNNGHCGSTEKIVTGTLLGVFGVIIAISSFTDSVKITSTGKVHYGLVTPKGLWSPAFLGSGMPGVEGAFYTSGGTKYKLRGFDFVNAVMSLAAFAALSLLSDPVTSCYFRNLSTTVMKSVPLMVSVVIAFLLTFAPAARNGIGFRVDATGDHDPPTTAAQGTTQASLVQGEPAGHSPAHSVVGVP